jgi:hypothetical protein
MIIFFIYTLFKYLIVAYIFFIFIFLILGKEKLQLVNKYYFGTLGLILFLLYELFAIFSGKFSFTVIYLNLLGWGIVGGLFYLGYDQYNKDKLSSIVLMITASGIAMYVLFG